MTNITASPINFSLFDLFINLSIGFILSAIISLHYVKRSNIRILRKDLAYTLPAIGLTTLLVITVVKSSLALSLGLVGALSIVRFRTPIKEPEELAYIFLSIAVGLSLGADQREAAVLGVFIILAAFSISNYFSNKRKNPSGNIHFSLRTKYSTENGNSIDMITKLIGEYTPDASFQRIDLDGQELNINCIIKLNSVQETENLISALRKNDPEASVSILDQSTYPNE